jgi:DNA-binding transcriptional regulator LsrR (DeoR family)
VDQQSLDLLVDVATRHYLQGNRLIEIARDLALDPSTISRYLKRARDEGIVRFEIVIPPRPNVEIGLELSRSFGLDRAIVAELPMGGPTAIEAVSRVAAEFVGGQLRRGSRVGIGWGETLAAVVRNLAPGVISELHVAQLAGGLADAAPGIQGHELARHLTQIYPDSRATYLHAPSIVDSPAIAGALLQDRAVQSALATAGQCDMAIVGIGNMEKGATLLTASHIIDSEREVLIAEGAVGSMNSRFYDEDGCPAGHLDDRTIAVEWSVLASIPLVIAVAGGIAKADAIRAALRSGGINVLVTDELTAAAVLA